MLWADFLKCAACALRRLAALHSDQQLRAKREAMLQALPLLSYLPFPASGPLVRAAISVRPPFLLFNLRSPFSDPRLAAEPPPQRPQQLQRQLR